MSDLVEQPGAEKISVWGLDEHLYEKTDLRGFRPGPTQTGLYSHRRWLEASNFGFLSSKGIVLSV